MKFDERKFRELCDEGIRFEDIGNYFGKHKSWAGKVAKELGIKKKRAPAKRRPTITPNATENLSDGVKKLIEKRRKILKHFVDTGDTSEAMEYCRKYKVPVPSTEEGFIRQLNGAAEKIGLKESVWS